MLLSAKFEFSAFVKCDSSRAMMSPGCIWIMALYIFRTRKVTFHGDTHWYEIDTQVSRVVSSSSSCSSLFPDHHLATLSSSTRSSSSILCDCWSKWYTHQQDWPTPRLPYSIKSRLFFRHVFSTAPLSTPWPSAMWSRMPFSASTSRTSREITPGTFFTRDRQFFNLTTPCVTFAARVPTAIPLATTPSTSVIMRRGWIRQTQELSDYWFCPVVYRRSQQDIWEVFLSRKNVRNVVKMLLERRSSSVEKKQKQEKLRDWAGILLYVGWVLWPTLLEDVECGYQFQQLTSLLARLIKGIHVFFTATLWHDSINKTKQYKCQDNKAISALSLFIFTQPNRIGDQQTKQPTLTLYVFQTA